MFGSCSEQGFQVGGEATGEVGGDALDDAAGAAVLGDQAAEGDGGVDVDGGCGAVAVELELDDRVGAAPALFVGTLQCDSCAFGGVVALEHLGGSAERERNRAQAHRDAAAIGLVVD